MPWIHPVPPAAKFSLQRLVSHKVPLLQVVSVGHRRVRSLVKSVQKMLGLTGFLMHDFSEPLIYVTFRVSQMELPMKTFWGHLEGLKFYEICKIETKSWNVHVSPGSWEEKINKRTSFALSDYWCSHWTLLCEGLVCVILWENRIRSHGNMSGSF